MKKHSPEEIRAKLGRAKELAERGLSQAEICSALGVSVMTFHRWRKLLPHKIDVRPAEDAPELSPLTRRLRKRFEAFAGSATGKSAIA